MNEDIREMIAAEQGVDLCPDYSCDYDDEGRCECTNSPCTGCIYDREA